VNAKNTIVIMTSNLGARDSERSNIGFGEQRKTGEDDKALKDYFKPELRNRIDQVCKFNRLDTMAIKKIVCKFVNELRTQLQNHHDIQLTLDENVIDHLAKTGYDDKMGARPLARKIDESVRVPLSKRILFERVRSANITARMDGDNIVFDVIQRVTEAEVGPDGIITVR
jgi:ATP-dependent Clp protease ATP-binding subunit ClpA